MEMKTLSKMEKKTIKNTSSDFLKLGLAFAFMAITMWWSYTTHGDVNNSLFLGIGALFGAYMAMNIGANDVANNVGPAVGAGAMGMGMAIVIAALFESSGALIAGGDVVGTIKKGIIDPALFANTDQFIWAMTAALLAGAIWLNLATAMGAPVSTTHSIVGGVMGGGIAAAGTFSIVAWDKMGAIASSWVISPVLGGVIAAGFLYIIKRSIVYKEDKIEASKKVVPILVGLMAWAFGTYLVIKGLKKVWPNIVSFINDTFFAILPVTKKPTIGAALVIGLILAFIVYIIVKKSVERSASKMKNDRESVNRLFTIPLIFAAALLSFAHGANDVANAVGPLAAIADAVTSGGISSKASIPLWVMLIGAVGISLGLALYGPKLIKTVGGEITELDQLRAFSIAMAAAITVIIASQLGLPVSTTHIAIGGIFGVGFLREYLSDTKEEEKLRHEKEEIKKDKELLKTLKSKLTNLEKIENKEMNQYEQIVELYKQIDKEEQELENEKRVVKQLEKVQYVKRDAVKKIVAAWVITVPSAAILSAAIFYMIRGIVAS